MRVASWRLAIGLTMVLTLTPALAAQSFAADPPAATHPAAPTDAERTAIRQVIEKQIAAFRADDAPGAMEEAAPSIRSMFGNDPATFLSMVKQGYQPVYRPRSVTFGALEDHNGTPVQHVDVIGPDGTPHTALYSMERQPDGVWRISGCAILDAAAVGA